MKAKIPAVLKVTVKPKLGLGSQLAAIGRSLGGVNIEIRRDPTPMKLAMFA
jgi:hypothetical protein